MSDKRPIGIFDSGVGGLTVAREIMTLLPGEEIIYLGDTANLPYGDKSAEIVTEYAFANTRFLLKHDIKVMVVACNTASSVALDALKAEFRIPIIGVIEPAAKGAIYATRNQHIGVIGTNRTIRSGVYTQTLHDLNKEVQVYSRACPLFVPLIEDDFIGHEATRLIALEYLAELGQHQIDSLILGCTHYPLLKDMLSEILPGVKMVDSASSTAQDLQSILDTGHLKSDKKDIRHQFFVTDVTDKLHSLGKRILDFDVTFTEVNL